MFCFESRAGTVISETWEDGQALKDVNSHLVCSSLILFHGYFWLCLSDINIYLCYELKYTKLDITKDGTVHVVQVLILG